MKFMFATLLTFSSLFTFADSGEISSELISAKEVNQLEGTYFNKKGISVDISIKKPLGQLDLFEAFDYEVEIKMNGNSSEGSVYEADGEPSIEIDEDRNITMTISQDDCDDPGCADTYHTFDFIKKSNGEYYLVLETEITQYLDVDHIYEYAEDTNGDGDIDRDEAENFDVDEACSGIMGDVLYATDIVSEGDHACGATALYYFNKK